MACLFYFSLIFEVNNHSTYRYLATFWGAEVLPLLTSTVRLFPIETPQLKNSIGENRLDLFSVAAQETRTSSDLVTHTCVAFNVLTGALDGEEFR